MAAKYALKADDRLALLALDELAPPFSGKRWKFWDDEGELPAALAFVPEVLLAAPLDEPLDNDVTSDELLDSGFSDEALAAAAARPAEFADG